MRLYCFVAIYFVLVQILVCLRFVHVFHIDAGEVGGEQRLEGFFHQLVGASSIEGFLQLVDIGRTEARQNAEHLGAIELMTS